MKKRLFIAIEISEELRCEIRKTDFSAKGFKAVNPDQLHLTLRFIGDFPEKDTPGLIKKLNKIRFNKFQLSPTSIGFFPNKKRPSAFFLAFSATPEILQLKSEIDDVLDEFQMERDNRDFVPHITLGRFKKRPEKDIPNSFEEKAAKFADISFSVHEFILFSSQLTDKGAIHTVEAKFTF